MNEIVAVAVAVVAAVAAAEVEVAAAAFVEVAVDGYLDCFEFSAEENVKVIVLLRPILADEAPVGEHF